MAQAVMMENGHGPAPFGPPPGINTQHFQFGSADDVINRRRFGDNVPQGRQFGVPATAAPNAPPAAKDVVEQAELGVLKNFKGAFFGHGYNMIFRPFDGNTQFPNPTPNAGPADNVLELNLTKETLTFSDPLG
jgi:hypothetical protein